MFVQARADAYNVTFKMPSGESKTVECPVDKFILDAGLEAGLDLPYKCREAQCTTCTAKRVEGALLAV